MKIDLDKLEAYARAGNGDPALRELVNEIRASTGADLFDAMARLESQLEMMRLTGEDELLDGHQIRERARLYAESDRASVNSINALIVKSYEAGAHETGVRLAACERELVARTSALDEANNKRQELVLELEAERDRNRQLISDVSALTVRATGAEGAAAYNEGAAAYNASLCEEFSGRIMSLTSQLDAARRTQLGQVSAEVDELRRRNAELESNLAKVTASLNDATGRLHEMTNVAAQATRDLARFLEREGIVMAREDATNAKLRDAEVRIAAFTEAAK